MKNSVRLASLLALAPVIGFAQDAEPGGVSFTFDFDQTFDASDDRDLTTEEREDGLESLTTLGFGVVTETRTQRLSFDVETGIRASDGDVSGDDASARLAFSRNSADAVLDISASVVRDDIEFLRDAADFINADGDLILPDDFEDLTGTGIRTVSTLSTALVWGETNPIGYRLGLSYGVVGYEDASAALLDSETVTLDAGVRLNISEVTTGNIDLAYSQEDEDGSAREDTTSLTGSLTFLRPLGDLTTRLNATQEDDGTVFWATSVDRRIELPTGAIEGSIGVAQDADGDARVVGGIDYTFLRPAGQIDLSADYGLDAGDDRTATTVLANFSQELTPVSTMRVGFEFGQTSDPDGSDRLATGGLFASYDVNVTRFWEVSLGARHDIRLEDGDRTRGNSVFVGLNRSLSGRR